MFHRPGYIFTDKKNPERGIMSAILGVIACVSVCLAVYLTYQNKGAAPMQYGSVILLSMVFSCYAGEGHLSHVPSAWNYS